MLEARQRLVELPVHIQRDTLPGPVMRGSMRVQPHGQRVDHTRKLRQDAVAHELDDPPAVVLKQRLDTLTAERRQPGQGVGLVGPIRRL